MRAHNLNHYYIASLCIDATRNVAKIIITNISLLILLSLLSFVTLCAYAQPKFKIFDAESGISGTVVTSIIQDRTGYLWVGTRNGLNRFDGHSFKIFRYSLNDTNSIASNYISCLAVDKMNRIWIGHESGITVYDPSIHSFTRIKINSKATKIAFISFDKYERAWVGLNEDGLVVLNTETYIIEKKIDLTSFINQNVRAQLYNTIDGMFEDSSGNVWLATQDGLYLYDRKLDTLRPIRGTADNSGKNTESKFLEILSDKNGGFWLAAFREGVCHYSPKENLFTINETSANHVGLYQDYFTNTVLDIAWKNEKELWVITWDKEKSIGTFDIQTRTFSFLKLSDIFGAEISATDLLFTDLFIDRDGTVWVASRKGLVMINARNSWDFTPVFKADSISISTIVEDTIIQKRFLGTGSGGLGLVVSDMNGNKVRSFRGRTHPSNIWGQQIRDLLNTSGDSLWVISRDNIRLFDKVREKWIDLPQLEKIEKHFGVESPSFTKMIRASSGDYWITTIYNGVYRLRGSDLSFVNFNSKSKNENSVWSNHFIDVVEDRFGRIWFASVNAGISIFDPAKNTIARLNNESKGSSFLPTNTIYQMDIDSDGNIWLATEEVGVMKINVISKDSLNLITFDNELLANPSDEVKIDGMGRVWFRSLVGVQMLDPKTMNIKTFEKKDGILNVDFA
ncbi:MAG TPA: two-component regulator propeller domain-containing protein, partial [Cyclobacteriaceae bacterium]|nr:two-component regulator propeller domain-containing protein [Cyclobacteriaceae bacterium]